jgi:hypothetical protein
VSKILVPEGMLTAVMAEVSYLRSLRSEDMEKWLEAALRWLSENPIVPSLAEFCDAEANAARSATEPTYAAFHIATVVEWQRCMFLATETEVGKVAKHVIEGMQGCTFSPAEADAIMEELSRVTHGWGRGQKAGK